MWDMDGEDFSEPGRGVRGHSVVTKGGTGNPGRG